MKLVVETNIAICANGGEEVHVGIECQISCINALQDMVSYRKKEMIVLDKSGLILKEYSKHLNYSGKPGVGDIFYKYLNDNQYMPDLVDLIEITEISDQARGFEELPENSFDPSDRKLLAAARVAKAEVVNASDSDWYENRDFVASLGVKVRQLCPDYSQKSK
jgi:predicted nucleic acid-binding protein